MFTDGQASTFFRRKKKKSEPFRRAIIRYSFWLAFISSLANPVLANAQQTAVDARVSGNFQLSADGARAGGLYPWSESGIAELPNGPWKKYGFGCWTSLAPDNSYRFLNLTDNIATSSCTIRGATTGKEFRSTPRRASTAMRFIIRVGVITRGS